MDSCHTLWKITFLNYLYYISCYEKWFIWSSVAPVCAVQQRRHYVVAPGGGVTVACQVQAYPTALTFTWALKNESGKFPSRIVSETNCQCIVCFPHIGLMSPLSCSTLPESPPIRLHSVGREEGLTGHYILRGMKQKSVDLLCWARNAAGTQATPCKLIVYTQGEALANKIIIYSHINCLLFNFECCVWTRIKVFQWVWFKTFFREGFKYRVRREIKCVLSCYVAPPFPARRCGQGLPGAGSHKDVASPCELFTMS